MGPNIWPAVYFTLGLLIKMAEVKPAKSNLVSKQDPNTPADKISRSSHYRMKHFHWCTFTVPSKSSSPRSQQSTVVYCGHGKTLFFHSSLGADHAIYSCSRHCPHVCEHRPASRSPSRHTALPNCATSQLASPRLTSLHWVRCLRPHFQVLAWRGRLLGPGEWAKGSHSATL